MCECSSSQIFQEIGAVQSLKRIVMYSSNGTACALAKRALGMMGEEVPRRILSSVPNWKGGEVQRWLQVIGFSSYTERFQVCVSVSQCVFVSEKDR